jgi:hypothetical protein
MSTPEHLVRAQVDGEVDQRKSVGPIRRTVALCGGFVRFTRKGATIGGHATERR